MSFQIDPTLLADCHRLGKLGLSHVLLHKNALVPWLILVPEVEAAVELFEVPEPSRLTLARECDAVARFAKAYFGVEKMNVAAIGNVVRQLHIHVVGRSSGDVVWPGVVWGRLTDSAPYSEERIEAVAHALEAELGLARS